MDSSKKSYVLASETSSDESSLSPYPGKSFKCPFPGCGKLCARNIKLTYHMRRHTNERPFVCDVPNCNKSYAYPNHLRRHKDVSHSQCLKEPLSCTHKGCFLKFSNKYSLNKHVKRKHDPNREYRFKCTHCNEGFHKKSKLLLHVYGHTGICPFACDECDSKFVTAQNLERHMRTHTSYECKCEQTFERWSELLKHKKICEASILKCNVCNKIFKQKGNLVSHLETHTGEAANRVFTCGYENCNREYSYKKNLITHIHKCHKKIEKPKLKCTYPGCISTLSKNQNLKKHLEVVHSNKKVVKKERRPRKDKGVSKPVHSAVAVLTGAQLPLKLHRKLIKGVNVEKEIKSLCELTEKDVHDAVSLPDDREITEVEDSNTLALEEHSREIAVS